MNFFNVEDLINQSPDTHLFHIVGQRSVGKTYSVKRYAIKRFLEARKKFIYVRRWSTEIGGELTTVFSDVTEDPELDWALYDRKGEYYRFHILPKANNFWLVGETAGGDLSWLEVIGRATCVSKAEQFKGGAYLEYSTIMFDEYVTERGYYKKDREPEFFAKIINTVGRAANSELKIFMLGNPDASIEACPYLYPLHLDYARIQPNTTYYYDAREGKNTKARNILFIKLANFDGAYLNAGTSSLFGTSEEDMSRTGNVKTYKYIHVDYEDHFRPYYELVVETPVLTETEYHRRIYCYYGTMWDEPVCVVLGHKTYDVTSLYCRYDKNDFRQRETRQTFRVNIPPDMPELLKLMRMVESNQLYITDDDGLATLYANIRCNS